MKRSGVADLTLHGGRVPHWLAQRMTRLGAAITKTNFLGAPLRKSSAASALKSVSPLMS